MPYSDEERAALKAAVVAALEVEGGLTLKEACAKADASGRTIRRWARSDLDFGDALKVAYGERVPRRELDGGEPEPGKISPTERVLRKRLEQSEDWWAQLQAVAARVGTWPHVEPKYVSFRDNEHDMEEVVLLFLSDTQCGQRVRAAETSGIEEYNLDVFRQRVERYKAAVYAIVEDVMRRAHPVHNCVVLLGGDMVEGEGIFPNQQAKIDLLAMEQWVTCAGELARLLQWIAGLFDEVTVQGVPGNHGSVKGTTLNLDQCVYILLRQMLAAQENIVWNLATSDVNAFLMGPELFRHQRPECVPTTCVLVHGNEIRSQLGTPNYAATRAQGQYGNLLLEHVGTLFLGHHHRAAIGENQSWCINGSWPGATDYSIARMRSASRPQQWLWTYHQEVGWTSHRAIYLAERKRLEATDGQLTSILPELERMISGEGGD